MEPNDFDSWWHGRIEHARTLSKPATLTRYKPDVYDPIQVYDVAFSGDAGDLIYGWYLLPHLAKAKEVPVVVSYAGYGGGRGMPVDHLALPAIGIACLVMDNRGQGAGWTTGATGDPGRVGEGPEFPGVMTRGIGSLESYYFGRLFVDAVRAVEVAQGLPGADPRSIAVCGASQGGGLALAAAGLAPEKVRACIADVPLLCDINRAIGISPSYPYKEISDFLAQHVELVDDALATLTYFDCALLARRITVPTLVSVGHMDEICPPSTVYAAYNEITAPKQICARAFGSHVVPSCHAEHRLAFLNEQLFLN